MSFTIDTRICGIPATVKVHTCRVHKGTFDRNAPSDLDYYGYTDLEYTVCDSRGRPADWLERKMTKWDREKLEEEIMSYE